MEQAKSSIESTHKKALHEIEQNHMTSYMTKLTVSKQSCKTLKLAYQPYKRLRRTASRLFQNCTSALELNAREHNEGTRHTHQRTTA